MVSLLRGLSFSVAVTLGMGCLASRAEAQQEPSIGYTHPAGAAAGSVIETRLGGYNWTPDMQIFVHDPRVKLEVLGPPGEVIVPEPPYWFGKKARGSALPMPRETLVRLTVPADMPAGPVQWQAANANGATGRGVFWISHLREVVEQKRRKPVDVQELGDLPVVVSGQVRSIEEVDRYRFRVARTGPVTCSLFAKRLNSQLRAIVEVRDSAGNLVAEMADTEHRDPSLTFHATAGQDYSLSLYDLDFRGDRSLTYRVELAETPRVVATLPTQGQRGQTQSVTFVGYGIATGTAQLETVTQSVAFPATASVSDFHYTLQTNWGAVHVPIPLSDLPQAIEPASSELSQRPIAAGTALSGTLSERYGEDRYQLMGQPNQPLWIGVTAQGNAAGLDVSLAVMDQKGQMIVSNDDLPGSTDAGLLFTAPAAEPYQIVVSDASGRSGNIAATYSLEVAAQRPDFVLTGPELVNLPVGTKVKLPITVDRRQGFAEPVKVTVEGLPEGVTVPADIVVAGDARELQLELTSDANAPALASVVTIHATATLAGQMVTRKMAPVVVAGTLKPPFTIDAGGKDDVTKWPRGTAFPAPVLIERQPGFDGEIRLEMAAFNDQHRQGIRGPEMIVPPGTSQVTYPVTLPEWLETTRTSRIILNGVAKIKDPRGNERHVVSRLLTRIGFLPGGALLKVAAHAEEMQVTGVEPFAIPVQISRSPQLTAPVKIELVPSEDQQGSLLATPVELSGSQVTGELRIVCQRDKPLTGRQELTIRSSSLKDGFLPVISETRVLVEFLPEGASAAAR